MKRRDKKDKQARTQGGAKGGPRLPETVEERQIAAVRRLQREEALAAAAKEARDSGAQAEGKARGARRWRRKTARRRTAYSVFPARLTEWLRPIAAICLAVLLAYGAAVGFGGVFSVSDGAMGPTLQAGDRCLVDRVSYKLLSPRRGDIILFRKQPGEALRVKRVVGIPGDRVQIREGKVLINGQEAAAAGLADILDPGLAAEPFVLDPDQYFVLGDNRNGSEDSRFAAVGNVDAGEIEGRLWLRLLPWRRFSLVRRI